MHHQYHCQYLCCLGRHGRRQSMNLTEREVYLKRYLIQVCNCTAIVFSFCTPEQHYRIWSQCAECAAFWVHVSMRSRVFVMIERANGENINLIIERSFVWAVQCEPPNLLSNCDPERARKPQASISLYCFVNCCPKHLGLQSPGGKPAKTWNAAQRMKQQTLSRTLLHFQ